MLIKVKSVALIGLESIPVEVEVDVATLGFPGFNIVGLAGKAVGEARERVKTAIINSGMDFPGKKITVNLAPADLPKEGGAYDLPIAIGILAASEQITLNEQLQKSLFYGELSLDGSLRATKGVLLVAMFARNKKIPQMFVPEDCANEASIVGNVHVYPVKNLRELLSHVQGTSMISKRHTVNRAKMTEEETAEFDICEIAGQEQAKRALLIAAAGGHNLLMSGPPGAGKTMLARAMPGILPPLSQAEALEVTRVYSVAGLLTPGQSLVKKRPFRSPHHGISSAGIIGGGSNPLPGEVSLAHLGVLFLDEMAEFPRTVLESLRQPLEDGTVSIVRAKAHVSYPASFTLLAAINPCPCGYLGHPKKECRCTDKQIRRYKTRLSGPILDRIDLHVSVPSVDTEKLTSTNGELNSQHIRKQVINTRKIQELRLAPDGMYTNSQMRNKHVKKYCTLDPETQRLLRLAIDKYNLSARTYFRLIKVARTIADLEKSPHITLPHMAEALQYKASI